MLHLFPPHHINVSAFQKYQHFRSELIQILVSMVFNGASYKRFTACLTLMVTLMALFMLPLHSQPCLETPPFWDPREAVSCRGQKHSEGGVRLRVAVPTEWKYHTASLGALLQNVEGDLYTPPDLVHRNSLMLQYEMKQSSTWCSSAPFQTGRGRLNKQWASNQINIHVFPCKAKTNSLKQPTLLWS